MQISTAQIAKLTARFEVAFLVGEVRERLFVIDDGEFESFGVAADGQTEEDYLHNGQCENEQHNAHVTPHFQKVLLHQGPDFARRCPVCAIAAVLARLRYAP